MAVASPGNEEAAALSDTHGSAGADAVTTAGGNVRTSGEWGALSGDLTDVPTGDVTQVATDGVAAPGNQAAIALEKTTAVYDVPVEVLGRAVGSGFQRLVVPAGDPAPRLDAPFGGGEEPSFGPSDDVDGLLRADQVPALRNLPLPGPMPAPLDATQVFPILSDGLPSTVESPERLSGELPVSGSRPRHPGARSTPGLPAAPIPHRPHLPRPQLSGPTTEILPRLGGPSPRDVPGPPAEQDTPVASAAQLMAQLRRLIRELESAGSGQLRPLDVTSFQEPDVDGC